MNNANETFAAEIAHFDVHWPELGAYLQALLLRSLGGEDVKAQLGVIRDYAHGDTDIQDVLDVCGLAS